MQMIEDILSSYGINEHPIIKAYGNGLINHTWRINTPSGDFILQRINDQVFKKPGDIAHNLQLISKYIQENVPGYYFPAPLQTIHGDPMIYKPEKGYFRLFRFVQDSHTVDVARSPTHAYEAARQFGLFTKLLAGLEVDRLRTTIPDFHNLTLRYQQFKYAVEHGNALRIKETQELINFIQLHDHILVKFEKIRSGNEFKLRVTHHDTKISNVLFSESGNGLCVVDLDTVMPGYFISDVGDMMRTYLSAASEEEKDFDKIQIRDEYFIAILNGYLPEMVAELSEEEINSFVYSGMFMTYMQSIRFLTDYLQNDVYYGSSYEKHNYVRAKNQATLLQRLLEKESKFNTLVRDAVSAIVYK